MAEILDYKCSYDNASGMNLEVTSGLLLHFPEAHLDHVSMVTLALALKAHDGASFCELPFCHTLEAEGLGGKVNLGDDKTGPRAGGYVCSSIEELDTLLSEKHIDFSSGRVHEVLETARILCERGERVMFELCGPFTVLNVLIDPKYVFKGMRKKPDLMKKIFWRIGEEVLAFMEEAKKAGVQIISYADVVGGVNILGPKMCEQVMDMFTYEYCKKILRLADEHTIIMFCPKTSYALIGTGHAEFVAYDLPAVMTYQEAAIHMIGKCSAGGAMCMKNAKHILKDQRFKVLKIN